MNSLCLLVDFLFVRSHVTLFFSAMDPAFAHQSLATSTLNKYRRLWSTFISMATAKNLLALPASAATFEQLVSDFASWKKSVPLTLAMVAAVNHFHSLAGFQSPSNQPRMRLILRGIKRAFSKPAKHALPLSPCIIKSAIAFLGDDLARTSHFQLPMCRWRTVAALVLSYAALARYSCLARLKYKHIIFSDQGMHITFPSSKTDQLNAGQSVFVSRIHGSYYCPVLILRAYTLRLQYEAFLAGNFPFSGPLFPALHRVRGVSRLKAEAFTHQGATKAMRSLLEAVGVPDPEAFTLHSGRRGGATHAALNGCDFLAIKRQGRWKSDSCPQLYIDDAYNMYNNYTSFLGL